MKIDAAEAEISSLLLHVFFVLVETSRLRYTQYPQCNSISTRVCYASGGSCRLETRRGEGCRGLVSSLLTSHPQIFFCHFQTGLEWHDLRRFIRPLQPQKTEDRGSLVDSSTGLCFPGWPVCGHPSWQVMISKWNPHSWSYEAKALPHWARPLWSFSCGAISLISH